ncbi:MAG TPA: membrane dipeptidase [Bryobacteraceae bacterium]|nr:membrane dipeptidase [Bryobacteraceae bacterium]
MPRLLIALLATASLMLAQTDESLRRRAERVHQEAIVIDTHNDITSAMLDEGFDLAKLHTDGKSETDIPRMRKGGVDAEFFAIYVAAEYAKKGGSARRALEMIDALTEAVRRNPDSLELATTAAGIRRIAKSGKISALMGLEGGHAIEDSLPLLRQFYRLGVRYMTLTHSNTNNWADSSGDMDKPNVEHHNGLTSFGRQVIAEMNRLGMMVDISHVSDKTFYDVIEVSKAPVIASHSSARAVASASRNMTDDMLRAVAKNNGVVMVNFGAWFLDDRVNEAMKKLRPQFEEIGKKYADDPKRREQESRKLITKLPKVPLSKLVDHIDHIAKVAGLNHVGLGSDFDGVSGYLPQDADEISKLPNITYELLKRGYSDADAEKILGGNFLRVMAAVERAAER